MNRYGHKIYTLLLVVILLTSVVLLTACDSETALTIDNRMPFDIHIIHEALDQEGKVFLEDDMGIIPANETAQLRDHFFLRQDVTGWTVVLKAKDPSGDIVWHKTWTFHEFLELSKVGWEIIVNPETSD